MCVFDGGGGGGSTVGDAGDVASTGGGGDVRGGFAAGAIVAFSRRQTDENPRSAAKPA